MPSARSTVGGVDTRVPVGFSEYLRLRAPSRTCLSRIPSWGASGPSAPFTAPTAAAIAAAGAEGIEMDSTLVSKVSLHQGDITRLDVDAIVNAANTALVPGAGVCGAIFRGAGYDEMRGECKSVRIKFNDAPLPRKAAGSHSTSAAGSDATNNNDDNDGTSDDDGAADEFDDTVARAEALGGARCPTGHTVATRAHALPARAVLHTVGPTSADARALASCYATALDLCRDYGLRSVAFPCVATGIYGFPTVSAARTALRAVREWLQESEENAESIDRYVIVV